MIVMAWGAGSLLVRQINRNEPMGYLVKHGVTGETYYRCLVGDRARRVAVSMSMSHNQSLVVRWQDHGCSTQSVAYVFHGEMKEVGKDQTKVKALTQRQTGQHS
jgi:hypothetical protein